MNETTPINSYLRPESTLSTIIVFMKTMKTTYKSLDFSWSDFDFSEYSFRKKDHFSSKNRAKNKRIV
jgi:hypothetical protein